MNYIELISQPVLKLLAGRYLNKLSVNSFDKILKQSLKMIDDQTLREIKRFIISQQTPSGGFADRGGRSDIYYSLFGYFIAEALDIQEVMPSLKEFVKRESETENLDGIYLSCCIILYANLFGKSELPEKLKVKSGRLLSSGRKENGTYNDFVNLLTFYYSQNMTGLFKAQRRIRKNKSGNDMPCPVTAANIVIRYCFNKPVDDLVKVVYKFYRNNGSFSATLAAPAGDLLSTSVALYSLRFVNSDTRLVKPDCLGFIDSLYTDGGFCATVFDTDPDVEYTFYGLLGLGALTD